jgi:hypothetical protein
MKKRHTRKKHKGRGHGGRHGFSKSTTGPRGQWGKGRRRRKKSAIWGALGAAAERAVTEATNKAAEKASEQLSSAINKQTDRFTGFVDRGIDKGIDYTGRKVDQGIGMLGNQVNRGMQYGAQRASDSLAGAKAKLPTWMQTGSGRYVRKMRGRGRRYPFSK